MSYYLRIDNKNKGKYLQIYDRYWDKNLKQARSKHVQTLGFVDELVSDKIPDPVVYYKEYVAQLNDEQKKLSDDSSRPRISDRSPEKNIGMFLIRALIDELGVKKVIDILSSGKQFQFSLSDMVEQLICARIVAPCSKSQTVSRVFPQLWNSRDMSAEQVCDGLGFIGENYKKYIELFNTSYTKFFKRDYGRMYFDCTNYYFEIDLPKDDKQKGPSKENRREPIIGQALLLDADLVPVAMEMFPGNESEKPHIRKMISETKERYKTDCKVIQVADKGLNCAKNIYSAVKEAKDGYIFSKSFHGHALTEQEKKWILLENEENRFKNYYDEHGELKYRLKSCVDTYEYYFREDDGTKRTFSVKEKRIVSYSPALARKQKLEIMKLVEKATSYTTLKKIAEDELGDASKYIKTDKTRFSAELNQEKITEDMAYAGYNLLVTSETNLDPDDVYRIYHNLWKIEESFRITKSYLDARPVYLQKQERIYGHFLICYLSLFLLRVLEIKCFKNKINSYDLIEFIRDLRVVENGPDSYINISQNCKINEKLKELTGLANLDALYLTRKEIDNFFGMAMLVN